MRQAKTDLAEQIFSATDRLMAREGLNQLSMHKLAKEANVAAGTIYLYFKNKDELLEQFAHRVQCLWQRLKKILMKLSLFSNSIDKCGKTFGISYKKIPLFYPI